MVERRSSGMIVAVLIALAAGVILAAALPVAGSEGDDFDSDEIPNYFEWLRFASAFGEDKWWLAEIARVGVVLAAVSAIAFPYSERRLQAFLISLGSLATLGVPIWLQTLLEDGESLGSGVIASSIAFIIAAVIPWFAQRDSQFDYRPTVSSSGTG